MRPSQENHPTTPLRAGISAGGFPNCLAGNLHPRSLGKGQTILIHGAAGAVGAYTMQLASQAAATIVATASGDDEAYLNSLGASRVPDYRKTQFEKVLRGKVDVVFRLGRWQYTEAVVPRLEARRPSRLCHPAGLADDVFQA